MQLKNVFYLSISTLHSQLPQPPLFLERCSTLSRFMLTYRYPLRRTHMRTYLCLDYSFLPTFRSRTIFFTSSCITRISRCFPMSRMLWREHLFWKIGGRKLRGYDKTTNRQALFFNGPNSFSFISVCFDSSIKVWSAYWTLDKIRIWD